MSIQDSIDITNVTSIEPKIAYNNERASKYLGLVESEIEKLIDVAYDEYNNRAVNLVFGSAWDWKRTSYSNYAKTHELIFKEALGITTNPRNGSLLAVKPTSEESRLANQLHHLSVDFFDHHFGDYISVYRGINRAAVESFVELLDNPEKECIKIDRINSLTNFSLSEIVARDYGLFYVECDISVDSIGFGSDFILKQINKGETINAEGEIQVIGDDISEFKSDEIRFPSSKVPVRHGLTTPSDLEKEDLSRVRDILNILSKNDEIISSEYGKNALLNWFDYYEQNVLNNRREVLRVDKLVRSCIGDEIYYYGQQ